MDGERKKRKLDVGRARQEEGEKGEEAKMEKFYELIRSSKEITARLNMINGERVKEEEKKKEAWNPTFQPEDFMEDGLNKILCPSTTNNRAGPSDSKKREDDREREEGDDKGLGDDGLDLKLSL